MIGGMIKTCRWLQVTLERDLFKAQIFDQMLQVCVYGVFFICGFCARLRGE
jgi:hypothetical protein